MRERRDGREVGRHSVQILFLSNCNEIRILIRWHLERRVTLKVAIEVQYLLRIQMRHWFSRRQRQEKNSNWTLKKTISIQSHCPLFIAFLLLSLMQLRLTDQSTAGPSAQRRSERGCFFSACIFNSNPHCVLSKEQYYSILLDIVETDMKICSTTV